VPYSTKTHTIIPVYVSRVEARKIKEYAKRKSTSVSGLLKRLVFFAISAEPTTK